MNGFFLGGVAQGFQNQSQATQLADFRSRELALQQQSQLNSEKRFEMARNDKILSDMTGHISDFIEQYKIAHAGDPPDQVARSITRAIGPLMTQTQRFAQSNGRDPNDLQVQINALIAAPPKTTVLRQEAIATGGYAKNQASIAEANARVRFFDSGGLPADYSGGNPGGVVNLPNGKQAVLPPPRGQSNGLYEAEPQAATSPATPTLIRSAMNPQQTRLIEAAGFTPEQADYNSVQVAYGANPPPARSKIGGFASNIIRARAAQYWIEKGVPPEGANAVVAEFAAMKHGAATAANIDARMTAALTKAKNTAPIVLERYKELAGEGLVGEYPTLNKLYAAAATLGGDTAPVKAKIAIETLASNYGAALGMGNSALTDFQTQRAQKLLEDGYNSGQMQAAVDQVLQEIDREESGTRQALHNFIGGMTGEIKSGAGSIPTQSPPPQPGLSGTSGPVKWRLEQ